MNDKIIFNSFPRSGSNYLFGIIKKFNDFFKMNKTFCGPENICAHAPCICDKQAFFTKFHDISFRNLNDFIHPFQAYKNKYIILVRKNKYENIFSFESWLKKNAFSLYDSNNIYNLDNYYDNFIIKYNTDIKNDKYFLEINNDEIDLKEKRVIFIYTEDLVKYTYKIIISILKFTFNIEFLTLDQKKYIKNFLENDKLNFTKYSNDEIIMCQQRYLSHRSFHSKKLYIQTIENTFECYVSPIIFKITNIYFYSLKNIFDCKIVNNKINPNSEDVIICFLTWYSQILNLTKKYKILYAINTENLDIHKYQFDRIEELNKICDKLIILDFEYKNITILKEKYNNIESVYLPPVNSFYINNYFSIHTENREFIEKKNIKDIDILIYGCINNRRMAIVNQIKEKRKDIIIETIHSFKNYQEEINFLKRTKIVLNVFSYDINTSYDFYRLSFLIYNDIFFVSEIFVQEDEGIDGIIELGNYFDYKSIAEKAIEFIDNKTYIFSDILYKHKQLFNQNYNFDKNLYKILVNYSMDFLDSDTIDTESI